MSNGIPTSSTNNDLQVIKSLFVALRTAIPEDTRLQLIRESALEVKFLVAVQPRVSSFSHRSRRSLRHPALSMATKRYYYLLKAHHSNSLAQKTKGDDRDDGDSDRPVSSSRRFNDASALLSDYTRDRGRATGGGGGGDSGRISRAGSAYTVASTGSSLFPLDSMSAAMKSSSQFVRLMESTNGSDRSRRTSVTGFFSSRLRSSEDDDDDGNSFPRRFGAVDLKGPPHLVAVGGGVILSDAPISNRELVDPEEEEQILAFQVEEEQRWEMLGYCYDQMLRAAHSSCRMAAHTAALDVVLNDIIRRFWDRVTVSPSAKELHRENILAEVASAFEDGMRQTANQQRAPNSPEFSFVAGRLSESSSPLQLQDYMRPSFDTQSISSHSEDEGRLDEYDDVDRPPTASIMKSTKTSSPGAKPAAKGRKGGGRTRNVVVHTAPETPEVKTKRKAAKKKKEAKAASTALYMTPLQYVYLNTRMASVLLPAGSNMEMEMLESARDDLIMDASYSEDGGQIELYFGKAPSLVPPRGMSFAAQRSPQPPDAVVRAALRARAPSKAARMHQTSLYNSGGWGAADADAESVGHKSMSIYASTTHSEYKPSTLWDPSRLPSLTYQQFWVSMMELADNWTCTASHPVEAAIFLLELYGEVFTNDWNAEDQALMTALQEQQAASELQQSADEVASLLDSFHELVQELDEWSTSDSDHFLNTDSSGGEGADGSASSGSLDADGQPKPPKTLREKRKKRAQRKLMKTVDWTGKKKTDGWRYLKKYDADGREILMRRKVVREMSRSAKKKKASKGEGSDDASGSDAARADSDSDESDYSIYVIEETLDENGNVIRRRKLRRRKGVSEMEDSDETSKKSKKRRGDSPDEFMYRKTGEEGHEEEMERYYYEEPAKRTRRLEGYRKVDAEEGRQDEDLSANSSWSSFSAGGLSLTSDGNFKKLFRPLVTEEERQSRRRQRVRRHGKRSEMRKYDRHPGYFYGQQSDADAAEARAASRASTAALDSLNVSQYEYSVVEDVDGDGVPMGSGTAMGGEEAKPERTSLTDEERAELMAKKDWLQRILAAKGVHIADSAFYDRNEEVLLYQLLEMTERLAKARREGREGDLTDEELMEDIGVADFDAALLAKVFAKPESYTLDDLQRSELMKLLLAMGEDGSGGIALTSEQMDGILSALMRPQNRGPPETVSMRRRRERMIAEAKRLRDAIKAAEKEKRRLAREEARRNRKKDTFDLTELPEEDTPPPTPPPLPKVEKPVIMLKRPGYDEDGEDTMMLNTKWPRPPTGPKDSIRPFDLSKYQQEAPVELDDLTVEQRKEQERLFREFQKYTMAQASQGGRYKLAEITEYTPEQLEAFYQHLHLGPQQRALLQGRAPLAAPTSLVGGTMHQMPMIKRKGFRPPGGTGPSQHGPGSAPPAPFKAAPVKLFTLTTADSLEGALRESYWSYMDDKYYHGGDMYQPTNTRSQTQQQQQQQERPWRANNSPAFARLPTIGRNNNGNNNNNNNNSSSSPSGMRRVKNFKSQSTNSKTSAGSSTRQNKNAQSSVHSSVFNRSNVQELSVKDLQTSHQRTPSPGLESEGAAPTESVEQPFASSGSEL